MKVLEEQVQLAQVVVLKIEEVVCVPWEHVLKARDRCPAVVERAQHERLTRFAVTGSHDLVEILVKDLDECLRRGSGEGNAGDRVFDPRDYLGARFEAALDMLEARVGVPELELSALEHHGTQAQDVALVLGAPKEEEEGHDLDLGGAGPIDVRTRPWLCR